jgi:hypothetical protein
VSKPQSVQAIRRLGSPTARDVFKPIGDDFRVLDKTSQIVDDTGGDNFDRQRAEIFATRDIGAEAGIGERQYVSERHARSCGPS